jgi:hypothetical protein
MIDTRWSDEDLSGELAEALREEREVPGAIIDAGREVFGWRTTIAELAEFTQARLTYDSLVDDLALQGDEAGLLVVTRSETAALRSLTFAAGELGIELEVTDDGVLGQLVPPQPATVELVTADQDGRTEVAVDDVGWFTIRPVPTTRFRLVCSTVAGITVVTAWIVL